MKAGKKKKIKKVALLLTLNRILACWAREGQDIESLDPAFMVGYEEDNIGLAVYSRPVEFKPDNPPELQKNAAREFEVSGDGL